MNYEDDIVWSGEMDHREKDYFQGVIRRSDKLRLIVAPPDRPRVQPQSASFARKNKAYGSMPVTAEEGLRLGLWARDLAWDYQRNFISILNDSGVELRDDPNRSSIAAYFRAMSN
jgi:hypothetical protein